MHALHALRLACAVLAVVALGGGAAARAADQVTVQWFGQSAFKLTSVSGKVIMIDPYISKNPKTPPAQRDLKSLGRVDLVLVTHAHGDHVGDGPALAKMHNAPLYAPPGLNDTLVALGVLPKELSPRFNKGGVITPLGPGIRITMTRAEHSSEFRWTRPDTGKTEVHVGGEPAGFVIEFENGFRVYHMGDTGLFGDMKFIGDYYRPDLVLIPVGGHFVLSPVDAAYATRTWLKPRHAIPMHYGTNSMLRGTPQEYQEALGVSGTTVHVLDPGGQLAF